MVGSFCGQEVWDLALVETFHDLLSLHKIHILTHTCHRTIHLFEPSLQFHELKITTHKNHNFLQILIVPDLIPMHICKIVKSLLKFLLMVFDVQSKVFLIDVDGGNGGY